MVPDSLSTRATRCLAWLRRALSIRAARHLVWLRRDLYYRGKAFFPFLFGFSACYNRIGNAGMACTIVGKIIGFMVLQLSVLCTKHNNSKQQLPHRGGETLHACLEQQIPKKDPNPHLAGNPL